MNLNLQNKNALICGGSKGLGLSSAMAIAAMGANVTLLSRNEESLKNAVAKLSKSDEQHHEYVIADLDDKTDITKEKITRLLDRHNYHILINNTGGPSSGLLQHASEDELVKAFHRHLLSSHTLLQLLVSGMKNDNYGRIINIVSTSVRQPIPGLGVSNVIRGAMASWSKTWSNELAPYEITVNNVLPGSTKTGRLDQIITHQANVGHLSESEVEDKFISQIPMSRFGRPEEIGEVVAFLASPAASYITGASVPVDGGKIYSI